MCQNQVWSFLILGLAVFALSTSAQQVTIRNCTKLVDRNAKSIVHSIAVLPCPEAPDGDCTIVRGSNVTITIDFTPTIKPNRRFKQGMYLETDRVDLPFKSLSPRACNHFNCTLGANVRQEYVAVIQLKRNLPANNYPVKVKIYQGRKVLICQIVRIHLT